MDGSRLLHTTVKGNCCVKYRIKESLREILSIKVTFVKTVT